MIVVSDTSPLTYLHQIERFALLSALYEEVVIPPAVERELKAVAHLHENLDWSLLLVVKPKSLDAVTSLYSSLDLGEAEAIVVASELQADLLLIDEADGRAVAGRMGIQYTGLLGVLLEAKTRNLLSAVSTELDRLQENTNFRIGPEVRRDVLGIAGEL
ncbi:MAG: DUF3368 domain-containing protein [Acidobacteriota bacterium]|nr:MAG: DUF3368 domain-containing protein [Acidobacteriota bacterium]